MKTNIYLYISVKMAVPLRVQYCSDLHLELCPSKTTEQQFSLIVKPVADILVLAGDICNPFSQQAENFLKYCVNNWQLVLYVPGNHEFYHNDYNKTIYKLYTLSKQLGFKIMEKNTHIDEDHKVVFIGCTLWSNIDPMMKDVISESMNDYELITHKNRKLTVDDTLAFHQESMLFLSKQIPKYTDYTIVVITHHAPVLQRCVADKYLTSPLQSAFSSDCTSLFEHVKYWIFGHTHFTTTFTIDNTTIMSNQYGYQGERTYNPDSYFDHDMGVRGYNPGAYFVVE